MSLHEGRGALLADSTGNQASSRLLSMRSANALLELPQGEGVLEAGATVTALLIGDVV
jgi:gephyrin